MTSFSPRPNFTVFFEFYVDMLFREADGSVGNYPPPMMPPPINLTNTRFQVLIDRGSNVAMAFVLPLKPPF